MARVVEHLSSIHQALGSSPIHTNQEWWHTPIISALGRQRQDNQKFKAILGYILSLRPAWTT